MKTRTKLFFLLWNFAVCSLHLQSQNLALNEIFILDLVNQSQFFEITGDPGTDITACSMVRLSPQGTVDTVLNFTGQVIPTDGHWLAANGSAISTFSVSAEITLPDGFFTNVTATYLLLDNFFGTIGDDLDVNDDGVLDSVYWSKLVDRIGVRSSSEGFTYAESTFGPVNDTIPQGVLRCGDNPNLWLPQALGVPLSIWSPGISNVSPPECVPPSVPVQLNEMILGGPTDPGCEFFEVVGPPGANLAACQFVLVDPFGVVTDIVPFANQYVPTDGVWVAASPLAQQKFNLNPNVILPNGIFPQTTYTYLLIDKFTRNIGDDIDVNNDGVIDSVFWSRLVDQMAFRSDSTGFTYAEPTFGPLNDSIPSGALRCGDNPNLWLPQSPSVSPSIWSPGISNVSPPECVPPSVPVQLNEMLLGGPTDPGCEFFEVVGPPGANLAACQFVLVDPFGVVTDIVPFANQYVPTDGVWVAASPLAQQKFNLNPNVILPNGIFPQTTYTYLLIDKFTRNIGDDIDVNNDGVIDSVFWSRLVDQMAFRSDSTGFTYAEPTFGPLNDSIPSGALRCGDNPNLWLPQSPSVSPSIWSPGISNVSPPECVPPSVPVQLNEMLLGGPTDPGCEFFEVVGPPGANLAACQFVLVDPFGVVTDIVPFANQYVPTDGVWVAASPLAQQKFNLNPNVILPNGIFPQTTYTYLLIDKFTRNIGDDIDVNNDGVIDSVFWSRLVDQMAFRSDSTGFTYAEPTFGPLNDSIPSGALRCGDNPNLWLPQSPSVSPSIWSPGISNVSLPECVPPSVPVQLNEMLLGGPTDPGCEFFEVVGPPGANLAACQFVLVDPFGVVTDIVPFANQYVPTDGVWVAASPLAQQKFNLNPNVILPNGIFPQTTYTYLLIDKFTRNIGDDIDVNNDGVIDSVFWSRLVDQMAFRSDSTWLYLC